MFPPEIEGFVHKSNALSTLSFYLNGTRIDLCDPNPHWTLLDFIRSQHGLKGTKLGCGEGGCGACTVVLQTRDRRQPRRIRHLAVNACLYPLVGAVGKHVITVEGLGSVDNPHPLQERLGKLHGSQCGFCTPGIVMSLYAIIRNSYDPETGIFNLSEDEIEMNGHLDGNLCRCTGYKSIIQAAKTFVQHDLKAGLNVEFAYPRREIVGSLKSSGPLDIPSCGRPGGCCRDTTGSPCSSSSQESIPSTIPTSDGSIHSPKYFEHQFEFARYSPGAELIYPPGLARHSNRLLCYGGNGKVWLRPVTVEETLEILAVYPDARLVGGASEVQVDIRFKGIEFPVSIFVGDIEELSRIYTVPDGSTASELVIGGNASLSEIEAECHRLLPLFGRRGSALAATAKSLRYFAGRQIRNAASLAGNIATASPISDMNPLLMAVNAKVVSQTAATKVSQSINSLFIGYRKTALPKGSIITQIRIPLPPPNVREVTKSYKQAKRKDDDIAIVTAAFRVRLDNTAKVTDIALAYGGMAPTTVLAKQAGKVLMGKTWGDEKVLNEVTDALLMDFSLPFGVPGGMATYRRTLTLSLFFRYWNEVISEFALGHGVDRDIIDELHRKISHGTRDNYNPYEQRVVGKQVSHLSGLKHTTGEAEYIDDMPPQHRELYGAMVLSQKSHAKIISVDWSPALEPGLGVGYVDRYSIPPEKNRWGSVVHDEPFFAEEKVYSHGQPIGLVYAETAIQAQAAARAVEVVYEELPAILTIDEAIIAKSFFQHGKELRKGVPPDRMADVFEKCDRVFSGTTRIGGQEHFYLETNAAMVIPHLEDGSMEVWSSTQNTMETQEFVSHVTGVPASRINARVKRMGGAFGGKESRSVQLASILAVAAKKEKRPIRAMLNRDEDMMTSGQRHPIQCRWKIGVMADGSLIALEADCYNNAGYSVDMSSAVMDRCCTHLDNCYNIPNVHIRAWVCKTNTHSNTAFRGFGGPQAMFIAESYMNAVAEGLDIPVDKLRLHNLYKKGHLTPFLQRIDEDWHIPLLLEQVREEVKYDERQISIQEFNAQHQWRKRGISLIPTKFGISFATALHLNQATAAVRIYTDGSVLLNHGGTEMGQGLYTKMVQVAAQELGVPFEDVYTQDTSSYQSANASPTAASSGSDLNGMAIKNACDQLNERLQPYRDKFGTDAPMSTLAHAAYRDRVNLSASGFWKMPTIGYQWGNYDPATVKPMYFYFTQGVACTEIELDLLTGDHTVLRTDIKMDVGRSINPAIDYGQVEGAFVQGQGLFTMEESLWTRQGHLATRGPGNYKIPGFRDIPQEFNVSFLQGVSWNNLRSIQTSKGIGEPPLFLGATVLFALRDALRSARQDNQVNGPLVLDSPATAERLRLSVGDMFLQKAVVAPKEGETSFFVTVA
ncbi:Molybdopterin-binding domain of aldehyde dehydrogenase-domain-containing protein [Aspergillus ambiguus]|uniref:Molybdopterin-binding domain of aldehyde dehydrogenase-domain-containing protein n=1 Tax=Aspergillus ambiguus TaxID=176160 RepID=UPI003CCD0758